MKRTFIATLILLTASSTYAQTLEWAQELGSTGEEYCLNHVVDRAGNIYVSGKTDGAFDGTNYGSNDGFIMKLSPEGRTIWKRQFGSGGDEDVLWSAIDNSGFVYITGSTTGNLAGANKGRQDIFVAKYKPSGEPDWIKQIGTDSVDIARGICTDNKGFIYITGGTYGKLGKKSEGKGDCFIIKIDKNGKIISTVQFGTPEDDNVFSIAAGTDDLFVCGTTWGSLKGNNNGFIDGFTGAFTRNLEVKGYSQFGSDGFDIPLVLHADKNNNLLIGGSTSGSFAGQQAGDGDCFLLKMDQSGKILWKNQFGTEHHDGVRGIDVDPSGSGKIYVSGIFNLPPEKAFTRIFKDDGSLLWEKIFQDASGKDINADHKGNFTHLGLTGAELFGKLTGGHDFYILKYRPE